MDFRFLFRKIRQDNAGNFAILTALALPVLLISAGAALNVVNALNAKSHLQAASDAASLAISAAYNNGITDQRALEQVAARYLKSNIKTSGIDPASLKYQISVSGTLPKLAHVNVSGDLQTFMPEVMGREFSNIAASTTTTIGSKTYYQVVFLLDVSGSMAIGGTANDISKLQTLLGCEFACHDPGHYNSGDNGDSAAQAKAAGIKLKFDYVQSALNVFVNTLKPIAIKNPGYFQLGIYTMGTTFQKYQAMTADIPTFVKSASNVYLEKMIPFTCATHNGYTSITDGLKGIIPKLANVGDGSSSAKRLTYVVMITDGVQDTLSNCNREWKANYATECQKVKAAGINMITIQTAYPEVANDQYTYGVKPIKPAIESTLRGCASDSDSYFWADDGPGIEAAIKSVFKKIFGNVRIAS